MAIESSCPSCGHVRFVSDHRANDDVVCSKCGVTYRAIRRSLRDDRAAPTVRIEPYYPDFNSEPTPQTSPAPTGDPRFDANELSLIRSACLHFELRQIALLTALPWCFFSEGLLGLIRRGPDRELASAVLSVVNFALVMAFLYLGVRGASRAWRAVEWRPIWSGKETLLSLEVVFAVLFLTCVWPLEHWSQERVAFFVWLAIGSIPLFFVVHLLSLSFVRAVAKRIGTIPSLTRRASRVEGWVGFHVLVFALFAAVWFLTFIVGLLAIWNSLDMPIDPVALGCFLILGGVGFAALVLHAIVTLQLAINLARDA